MSWFKNRKSPNTARSAEIAKTIIVPGNMLDSAHLGDFMRGTHSLRTAIPDNAGVIEASRRHPDSIFGFISFHITDSHFFFAPMFRLVQGFEQIGTMREVGRKFDKLLDVTLMQKILGGSTESRAGALA